MGPKNVFSRLKDLRELHGNEDDGKVIDDLAEEVCKKKSFKVSREILNVLIDCLIYEPANEVNMNGEVVFEITKNKKQYSYIYNQDAPKFIHSVLC